MTRRIVLAVLALVAAVLGVVAVPLGLVTAGQDRRDFQDEAVASATTLANGAEEKLDDGGPSLALDRTVSQLSSSGALVSVYDSAGRRIAGTAERPAVTTARLATGLAGDSGPVVYPAGDDRIMVVAPVLRDNGRGAVGAVVLVKPTSPINRRIAVLWMQIAIVSTAGLLAAALVAIGLARWLSRPLRDLEVAAQQLGDGDLDARSPSGSGPSEVRSLAANFNLMAARLQALVRTHQATMADVSHQLRTPLAALRLRLELLAQDSDEDAGRELAGAQDEIARLSRLVNGLLAVARAENVSTPPAYVALDELIRDRIAAWRPAADEREVRLVTGLEPVGARLSDGHLEQIMDNLIANALDALPAGGTIRISTLTAGDRARIVIADDGPGMTPQQQKIAFRRFATGADGGTGLGLAIVDRLTASNGGSAVLSDSPGGGLTVTIELPLARPDKAAKRGAVVTGRSSSP